MTKIWILLVWFREKTFKGILWFSVEPKKFQKTDAIQWWHLLIKYSGVITFHFNSNWKNNKPNWLWKEMKSSFCSQGESYLWIIELLLLWRKVIERLFWFLKAGWVEYCHSLGQMFEIFGIYMRKKVLFWKENVLSVYCLQVVWIWRMYLCKEWYTYLAKNMNIITSPEKAKLKFLFPNQEFTWKSVIKILTVYCFY